VTESFLNRIFLLVFLMSARCPFLDLQSFGVTTGFELRRHVRTSFEVGTRIQLNFLARRKHQHPSRLNKFLSVIIQVIVRAEISMDQLVYHRDFNSLPTPLQDASILFLLPTLEGLSPSLSFCEVMGVISLVLLINCASMIICHAFSVADIHIDHG